MKRNHILSLLASPLLASSAFASGSVSIATQNVSTLDGTSLTNKMPGISTEFYSGKTYGVVPVLAATSMSNGTLLKYGIEMHKVDISPFNDVGEMTREQFLEKKENAKLLTTENYLQYKLQNIFWG